MCQKSRKTKLIFFTFCLLLVCANGHAQEFLAKVDFKTYLFRPTDTNSFVASITYFLSGNRRFDLNPQSNCQVFFKKNGLFPNQQNKLMLNAYKFSCSGFKSRDYVYVSKRSFGVLVDYQQFLKDKKSNKGVPVAVFPYQGNQVLSERLLSSIERSEAYLSFKKKHRISRDLKSYLSKLDHKDLKTILGQIGYGQHADVIYQSLSKERFYFLERSLFYAVVFHNAQLVNELYKHVIH